MMPVGGGFVVVDLLGSDIQCAMNGDTTSISARSKKPVMGTPAYQPLSLVKGTTGATHLSDILAGATVLAQILSKKWEVYDMGEGGSTVSRKASILHNKVDIIGLGAFGSKRHKKLMLAEEERDWKWIQDGLLQRPGRGVHLITLLLGIIEINRPNAAELHSLNPNLHFPLSTVNKVFKGNDGKVAAEELLSVLVCKCCSLDENKRLQGLQDAILKARALAHCYGILDSSSN